MDKKLTKTEWVKAHCPYPDEDFAFCLYSCEHGAGGNGCKLWIDYMGISL